MANEDKYDTVGTFSDGSAWSVLDLTRGGHLARRGRYFVLAIALLMLGVLLQACAGTPLREPDWIQVRNDANTMRTDVNEVVGDVTAVGVPVLQAVCGIEGAQGVDCVRLQRGYNVARDAVIAARKAIDLYDSTGAAGEAVHVAVERVHELGNQFADAAQTALEALQHATTTRAREPGDGSGEAAAPPQGTGPAEGGGSADAAAPVGAP